MIKQAAFNAADHKIMIFVALVSKDNTVRKRYIYRALFKAEYGSDKLNGILQKQVDCRHGRCVLDWLSPKRALGLELWMFALFGRVRHGSCEYI